MKVKVAKKIYQMGRKQYQSLLKVASEQVPKGIYAVEKDNYAELCNHKCTTTQLKAMIRMFRQQGYKVHYNK